MRAREARAIAVDYDRTLTDMRLRVVEEALDALSRAREAGLKVVVVSGRDLPFLEEHVGHVADAIVGENGCLLHRVGLDPLHTAGRDPVDLRPTLECLNVPIEYGRVIASADVAHLPLVREALERAGHEVDLIRNVDRFMILPRGIDKAAGFLAALERVGVPPERAAAAGDGENDLPMLKAAGYGIAVANAVPELKETADYVADAQGGHGVAEWVEREWLAARSVAR